MEADRSHHSSGTAGSMDGRTTRFGFECRACSRCCYHKRIQINPFEAAALAGSLGIATERFHRERTEAGKGIYLARRDDGACTFLGPAGCTVHPVRPLVCRLYPLGRIRHADGSEEWHRLDTHPQSEGEFSDRGSIGEFIEQQDAAGLIVVADSYADWVNRARAVLNRSSGMAGESTSEGPDQEDLFDLDAATRAYCRDQKLAWPARLEDRWRLHLQILDAEIGYLKGEGANETQRT